MFNILSSLPSDTVMILIWLVICIIALIIESLTTELVSIYFSFGALISMICAILGVYFWPQVWIFVLVAAVSLFTTRPLFLKYFKKNEIKTNVDALVGKRFTLTKEITSTERGEVNVSGIVWSVVTNDNSSIEVNSTVEVLSLDGSKLIVKKI